MHFFFTARMLHVWCTAGTRRLRQSNSALGRFCNLSISTSHIKLQETRGLTEDVFDNDQNELDLIGYVHSKNWSVGLSHFQSVDVSKC